VDLSTWNVREYKLENDGEVGFILYRPVTHGLRTKHLELSLRLQGAVSAIEEAGEREEGELPSDEQIEKILASQGEAQEILARFRGELISALVVGCRDLTVEEKVPSREELVEVMSSLEDLATDFCTHVMGEGSIGEDEGKD
jgi:hypothetical protein